MEIEIIIGFIGALLILIAFFLILYNKVSSASKIYLGLNISGGTLATIYAISINALPLIIIEITWTIFATYKFVMVIKKNIENRKQ